MGKKIIVVITFLLWMLLATIGIKILWNYEVAYGKLASPPSLWPEKSQIILDQNLPTVLMFAHPQCPCTRASVDELATDISESVGKAKLYTLFYKPEKFDDSWVKTNLWSEVSRVPDMTVMEDIDGKEALLFNVKTSGNVLIYDPSGKLVFNGGITPSRGHRGINIGSKTLKDYLWGIAPAIGESFVYGCPLFQENRTHKNCHRPTQKNENIFSRIFEKIRNPK